ncbi:hypothetical protein EK904_003038 [Melospiza melodia maxima]|nr:hypothetical protein EK904_003038 [Melospiza melodia maxima]
MLSAIFAASTQPFCPLDKFSAVVIQSSPRFKMPESVKLGGYCRRDLMDLEKITNSHGKNLSIKPAGRKEKKL